MQMVVGVNLVEASDLLPFNGKDTLVTDGDTVAVSGQRLTTASVSGGGVGCKSPIGVHRLVRFVIDVTGAASTVEITGFGTLP